MFAVADDEQFTVADKNIVYLRENCEMFVNTQQHFIVTCRGVAACMYF